jgi:flagellar hook-associated protein 1 FlgK
VQSTFAPIELAKRGLIAHSTALQTVGHNMSNATVEGYSRQRVEMKAFEPIYAPQLNRAETPGQIGQGMEVSSITRVRDMLLESRIVGEQNVQGYWEARDKYLLMLEQVQNEPTDQSVRTLLDRFWQSWQELSVRPTETGARRAVLERGNSLAEGINSRYLRLKGIRDMIDGDIKGTVDQVNSLTSEISALSSEIIKSEALGDHPNDLYDRRDLLVGKLSTLIDITVSYRDEDELVISTGGMHLVQGRHHEEFALEPDRNDEGYGKLVWADGGDPVTLRGGTLASLVELRDVDTKGEIQALDLLTQNFVDLVNEVHRRGFGLDGSTGTDFFVQHPFIDNAQGNYDANGDGAYDATYVYRVTGANTLTATDQVGLRGTLTLPAAVGDVTVEYFPTDTVRDLVERINLSGAEVAARLNSEGRLSISGVPAVDARNPDFVLRGLQDSGRFLVGYAGILDQSGPAGAFTWTRPDAVEAFAAGGADFSVAPLAHPSGWIAVNPKMADDPNAIAAASALDGRSAGPGDGTSALAIAQLRTEPVVLGVTTSFDNFFADRAASIGLRGEEAARSLETVNLVMKDLTDTRESLSGVNMDEELTRMLTYQRGYESIARIVTTFDTMLDTIINRMAV